MTLTGITFHLSLPGMTIMPLSNSKCSQSGTRSWIYVGTTYTHYDGQYAIDWENVTVGGMRIPLTDIQKITEHYITDVPDVNQPCANPLNVNGFTNINFCAPTSALNITEYWNVIKGIDEASQVDGKPNPGPTSVLQFIAWWINTNDDHAWDSQNGRCPYRVNGYKELVNKTTNHFNGTALQDCTVGLAQYVRWDSTHDFWANPPALLKDKLGHDWTVTLLRNPHLNGSLDWGSGWSAVVSEINAHRPLIAVWDWWNPINPDHRWGDGFTYCDLGPNIEPAPGNLVGGHAVTIVGYIDDGGGGMGRVVAHDNWYTTDRDIVMKWKETAAAFTHCAALITVDPYLAPTPGTLSANVGTWNPLDQSVNRGAPVVMAQIALEAFDEDIAVNAIKLTAAGSGNDWWDISEINLVWDTNNDGVNDKGDVPLLIHLGGYQGNNGTLILKIPGDSTFKIAKNTTENLLVVYHISPLTLATHDYWFTLDDVMATGCTSHLQCTIYNGYTTSCKVTVKGIELGSPVRLSLAKIVCDGLLVRRWRDWPSPRLCAEQLDDLVITDCTTGFYVQEIDGSAGMRLMFQNGPPSGAEAGKRILIDGVTFTAQIEKVIMVSSAQVTTGGPQRVVAMPIRSVGGGDWYWDIIMHTGQQGVVGGIGLNNIGLLVKTWGKYTKVNDTTFTLDDGSGNPLKCVVPSGVTLQTDWTYVVATGVSSIDVIDGQPIRVLRLRIQDDVQAM